MINSLNTLSIDRWKEYYSKNIYYHNQVKKIVQSLIPNEGSVLEISCRGGEIISSLPNKVKVGCEFSEKIVSYCAKKHKKIKFCLFSDLKKINIKFDYIVLTHSLTEVTDIQELVSHLRKNISPETRIIVIHFNYLWKPILDIAEKLKLKIECSFEENWLSPADVENIFYLEDFERITSGSQFLIPIDIDPISSIVNRYVSNLPLVSNLGILNYSVYRNKPQQLKENSASIIIPARNESGNMVRVLDRIPLLGKSTEVIFVEGNSTDDTYTAIRNEIRRYKGKIKTQLVKQTGRGKGDAVRVGFSKASNDIFMILDADLTVRPEELIKFYNAIVQNKGELVMGSRLIYPMEDQAMQSLNQIGNKIFSILFTYLLGQRIKDTLCGTKVLTRKNYLKIAKNRKLFGEFDPFGDYDLIFGAAKLNLKITEIPIRYRERVYGKTNISRFKHGMLLIKMVLFAASKFKFI